VCRVSLILVTVGMWCRQFMYTPVSHETIFTDKRHESECFSKVNQQNWLEDAFTYPDNN